MVPVLVKQTEIPDPVQRLHIFKGSLKLLKLGVCEKQAESGVRHQSFQPGFLEKGQGHGKDPVFQAGPVRVSFFAVLFQQGPHMSCETGDNGEGALVIAKRFSTARSEQ